MSVIAKRCFQNDLTKHLKRNGLSYDMDIQAKKPRFEKNEGK